MSYNVKIVKYPVGGYQVVLYSETVGHDTFLMVDDSLDLEYLDINGDLHIVHLPSETGRLPPKGEYYLNPFEDEYIRVRSFADAERSEKVSRNRTLKNLYYDTRSNEWEWFITLTFDPKKVDRYDYDAVVKKLKNWLIMCRRDCPDMKYILVPELHKDGAFHFHGLIANCDALQFVNSGVKDKSGKSIYNIGKYKLGWTTATRVESTEKVSKYISKYITKELCAATFGRKRYWKSRNLNQAEIVTLTLLGDLQVFRDSVESVAQWSKSIDGYITTEYFEMPQEVNQDMDALIDNYAMESEEM